MMSRAAGVLLHPTSLPGPHGMGSLGRQARAFADFLADAGLSLWQVLPLGPTGYGDSPYASPSSFAGNPLLLDLEALVEAGWLAEADLADPPEGPPDAIDFGRVIPWKTTRLENAARRFLSQADAARLAELDAFRAAQAHWLPDWALFSSLKAHYDQRAQAEGAPSSTWYCYWAPRHALRDPEALDRWREEHAQDFAVREVWQLWFAQQWDALREHARGRGVRVVGDLPIFVAPDSADAWARRDLLRLDSRGTPTVVAGVPPDYFSATGQLWGNPLYAWEAHAAEGFAWWTARVRATLARVDWLRLDHFRGLAACWEVPAGELTAERGRWIPCPGRALLDALRGSLGELPILAEDLGVITPDVEALRDDFGLPGMRILQFAFDERESGGVPADNAFLPHNHVPNAVVYTGTHDNDTTAGWAAARTPAELAALGRYAPSAGDDPVWALIRLALASVARIAVVPMQDLLGLPSEARMNTPAVPSGNWRWRCPRDALTAGLAARVRELAALYGRRGA